MGTRVPLIAYWKGHTPVGSESDDLIDFTDFYTTFADVSSLKKTDKDPIDGRSFLPQLDGEVGEPRDWVFCHYQPYWGRPDKYKGGQFVRNQEYKLYSSGDMYHIPSDIHENNNLLLGQDSTSVEGVKVDFQNIFNLVPPAPLIEAGRDTEERIVYPEWRNIVDPND